MGGWSFDPSPIAALVTNALSMAISSHGDLTGTILHSVQGVRYGFWAFTERANASELIPSMSSVDDCHDNGLMESLWSRMQVETAEPKEVAHPTQTGQRDVRLHRSVPQPAAPPLLGRAAHPDTVRSPEPRGLGPQQGEDYVPGQVNVSGHARGIQNSPNAMVKPRG